MHLATKKSLTFPHPDYQDLLPAQVKVVEAVKGGRGLADFSCCLASPGESIPPKCADVQVSPRVREKVNQSTGVPGLAEVLKGKLKAKWPYFNVQPVVLKYRDGQNQAAKCVVVFSSPGLLYEPGYDRKLPVARLGCVVCQVSCFNMP